jgi:hypothetical protein
MFMKLPNTAVTKARFAHAVAAFQVILSHYNDLKYLFEVLESKEK